LIVDHHVAHDDFGDVIVRDVNACATGVVVMQLAEALGVHDLPKEAAAPLYAAIIADTGGFRYPNTTADTLRIAARLIDIGVEPWQVAMNVFESWPMPRMRLLGCAIDVLETEHNGRIAVQCIPLSMIEEVGATQQMVEGMVEYGRRLRGVEIAAMLWERAPRSDETGTGKLLTRVSLRSAGTADVSRVAVALGGGGHRAAAGATVRLDMQTVRARVVKEAARELGIVEPG
jgi:phosphoesterase RecJ-like protein